MPSLFDLEPDQLLDPARRPHDLEEADAPPARLPALADRQALLVEEGAHVRARHALAVAQHLEHHRDIAARELVLVRAVHRFGALSLDAVAPVADEVVGRQRAPAVLRVRQHLLDEGPVGAVGVAAPVVPVAAREADVVLDGAVQLELVQRDHLAAVPVVAVPQRVLVERGVRVAQEAPEAGPEAGRLGPPGLVVVDVGRLHEDRGQQRADGDVAEAGGERLRVDVAAVAREVAVCRRGSQWLST